jgi:hypothetical protein
VLSGPELDVVPPPPPEDVLVVLVVLLFDELLPHAAPRAAKATTQTTARKRCGLDRFVTPQTLLPYPHSVNVTRIPIHRRVEHAGPRK